MERERERQARGRLLYTDENKNSAAVLADEEVIKNNLSLISTF